MNKTGIVMKKYKNSTCLLTADGEFINVKADCNSIEIGQIYTGKTALDLKILKSLLAIILLVSFISGIAFSFVYLDSSASIIVSISPSLTLQVNRWDKVIKISPTTSDAEKITSKLHIKNKPINNALVDILNEAKAQKFINDNYSPSGKHISIYISSDGGKFIDISSFLKYAASYNILVEINDNGNNAISNKEMLDSN